MTTSETMAEPMGLKDIAAELGHVPSTVYGWGLSTHSESVVVRPTSVAELSRLFQKAREKRITIGMRGSGCSYGDASQNGGGILLDFSEFANIRSFDADNGIIVVEPGVTLEMVWRRVIAAGWWPPVVSGTMYPSLGGLLAANIHGKNNWRAGTIGEHVESFRFLDMNGEELHCSRHENSELFHAAIGSFGMLGCFTEITLKLKKVHSGYLDVERISVPSLPHMIAYLEENKDAYDYLVGWIDCFPAGKHLGRGLIHVANHLPQGADEDPGSGLSPAAQDLPAYLFGVLPKSWMWWFLKPFVNDTGMRLVNAVKYLTGTLGQTRGTPHREGHAAFAFLLDYVPDWKKSYGTGGLIQYQTFIPKANASAVHCHLLGMCHRAGLIPYLGVYKRHRPDPFLLTHAVDGFSFAMDFRVTEENRERLWELTHRMDEEVVEAGGRLYFAKDATTLSTTVRRIWPKETLDKFFELKRKHDPEALLQTNLARRVFPDITS